MHVYNLFFYFDKTIVQSFAVKNLYFYKNRYFSNIGGSDDNAYIDLILFIQIKLIKQQQIRSRILML